MGNSSFGNHPFLLGFDQLDRLIERSAKNDGYPPYNIEQTGENDFRITLAVAGFSLGELDITLANAELQISGAQVEDRGERHFLHRGIAARQFQRRFVLADGVEVRHAYMENGLLHIDLRRAVLKPVSHKIEINQR